MENEPIIVFDNGSKNNVLNAIGFKINEKDELVDDNGKIATDREFEPITSDNFGGVLKSSKIAIKKESSEIIENFEKLRFSRSLRRVLIRFPSEK